MGRVNSVEIGAKRQFQSDQSCEVSSDEGVVWRNDLSEISNFLGFFGTDHGGIAGLKDHRIFRIFPFLRSRA